MPYIAQQVFGVSHVCCYSLHAIHMCPSTFCPATWRGHVYAGGKRAQKQAWQRQLLTCHALTEYSVDMSSEGCDTLDMSCSDSMVDMSLCDALDPVVLRLVAAPLMSCCHTSSVYLTCV